MASVMSANLIMLLIVFFVFPLIIKKIWPYMVKSLFPKAVEENYISENIPWPLSIIFGFILLAMMS